MTDFLVIVGALFMVACFWVLCFILYCLYILKKGKIKEPPKETITYWSRKYCGNCASDCNEKTREINNADGECLCYEDGDHIKELKNKITDYAESKYIEEIKNKVIGGYQPKQGFLMDRLMDHPPKKK